MKKTTAQTPWIITIKKVRALAGICCITYKSSLQPQTLEMLVPRNHRNIVRQYHETISAAADKFYGAAN